MTDMTDHAVLDPVAVRRALEQELAERSDIVRELAPRAAPNVDPIAWTTTQATQRVIDQITAALERLDAGTYGACVRCAGAIPPERLEILPYVDMCVPCQAAKERV